MVKKLVIQKLKIETIYLITNRDFVLYVSNFKQIQLRIRLGNERKEMNRLTATYFYAQIDEVK